VVLGGKNGLKALHNRPMTLLLQKLGRKKSEFKLMRKKAGRRRNSWGVGRSRNIGNGVDGEVQEETEGNRQRGKRMGENNPDMPTVKRCSETCRDAAASKEETEAPKGSLEKGWGKSNLGDQGLGL